MPTPLRRFTPLGLAALSFAAMLALVAGPLGAPPAAAPAEMPDLEAACREGQPYVAAVCFPPPGLYGNESYLPTVTLFRDTPGDTPQFQLATYREVGAGRASPTAGANPRSTRPRSADAGPSWPRGVSGASTASTWRAAGSPCWPACHRRQRPSREIQGTDPPAAREAGKTGLGDIDLNATETELYAVNLYDRRIYRFALPDGTLLGSFANGATGEPWAVDARPFGLAFAGDRLYHRCC